MIRSLAILLLAVAVLVPATPGVALDGGGIDTVFAVRKNTSGHRVDYGIRLDAQCQPRGDDPVIAYFRRQSGGTRELTFLERTVYGTRHQRVRRDGAGGRVAFSLRALPDRSVRIVTRPSENGCAARAITEISGQPSVITDVYVVLDSPRRVNHIEVSGRTIEGAAPIMETLRD